MSVSGFKEYDADRIMLLLGLIPIQDGLAENSFVTLSRVTAMFTDKASVDGLVTRSKTNDRRGQALIKTMQSSDVNVLLSALAINDENSSNGDGVTTFALKDLSGTTLATAAKAWISELPESDFAREANERVWKIRMANLVWVIGGN